MDDLIVLLKNIPVSKIKLGKEGQRREKVREMFPTTASLLSHPLKGCRRNFPNHLAFCLHS